MSNTSRTGLGKRRRIFQATKLIDDLHAKGALNFVPSETGSSRRQHLQLWWYAGIVGQSTTRRKPSLKAHKRLLSPADKMVYA